MIFSNNGIQSMYQTRTAQQTTLSDTSITPLYEPKMLSYYCPNHIMNADLDLKNAPDFFPTPKNAEVQGYQSLDPRLIDPRRNIHQVLDRPAHNLLGFSLYAFFPKNKIKTSPMLVSIPITNRSQGEIDSTTFLRCYPTRFMNRCIRSPPRSKGSCIKTPWAR